MEISGIKAIVFDLWETLIPFPKSLKTKAFLETAKTLNYEPSQLKPHWEATRRIRETINLEDYFYYLRNEINANWSDHTIKQAMEVRKSIHGSAFENPDVYALYVFYTLQKKGIKTAVISNCSSDVREMLMSSQIGPLIDEVILSSEVGIMKPDVSIYKIASDRLNVPANQCIFLGDGNDNELDGAKKAGMNSILMNRGYDRGWNGSGINQLSDILMEVEIH
ncbi:HAD family hydrolase [Bacillus sp. 22475]|uniref:HAD family hydrolase n=1 Tax=unclassified Bacillus (in: firmicutes) TaxID=185979 RepID=UPI00089ED3F1|nr:HAD family hydrolase [Bacillus sp. ok061]MED1902237.1 HAD family hydrolase [Bacillus thuringiensis]SEG84439.1 putative hydrolase of the HAD superfamily [Bacillus sp. ok061]